MDEKLEKLTPFPQMLIFKKISHFAKSGTMDELEEVVPTSMRIWIYNHLY
jgi:hypothetical protein